MCQPGPVCQYSPEHPDYPHLNNISSGQTISQCHGTLDTHINVCHRQPINITTMRSRDSWYDARKRLKNRVVAIKCEPLLITNLSVIASCRCTQAMMNIFVLITKLNL